MPGTVTSCSLVQRLLLVAAAGFGGSVSLAQSVLWPAVPEEAPVPCSLPDQYVPRSLWNANLWPGGIVHYQIDPAVTQQNRDRLRIAMDEIQTNCNVTFIPSDTEPNRLYVQNGGGNSSFVGRVGGAQTVNLVSWSTRYVIVHELMHALGVWHEQQRSDRDGFVVINEANIQSQYFSANFTVRSGAAPQGTYDFESIMHYDECAFSTCCPAGSQCGCPANCRAIDVRPGFEAFATAMGNRSYLSNGDKSGLASRYGAAVDDSFEDNDSLAAAAAIALGTRDLKLFDGADYFRFTLPRAATLTAEATAALWAGNNNGSLRLFNSSSTQLATTTFTDPEADGSYTARIVTNLAAGTYSIGLLRAEVWGGAYRLTLSIPACVADTDDGSGSGVPDGGVGIEDLLFYLGLYSEGSSRADIDDGTGTGTRDGGIGIEDLLYYLTRYDAGC